MPKGRVLVNHGSVRLEPARVPGASASFSWRAALSTLACRTSHASDSVHLRAHDRHGLGTRCVPLFTRLVDGGRLECLCSDAWRVCAVTWRTPPRITPFTIGVQRAHGSGAVSAGILSTITRDGRAAMASPAAFGTVPSAVSRQTANPQLARLPTSGSAMNPKRRSTGQ